MIEAVGGVWRVATSRRGQADALMWQSDVEIGLKLDRLRRTSSQTIATVGAITRNALPEDLHQQIEITEPGQLRASVVKCRTKRLHDADATV